MKHFLAFSLLTLIPLGTTAQIKMAPTVLMHDDNKARVSAERSYSPGAVPETVIWSEDFANGIPSTWGNSGIANGTPDPDCVWEYRGPNTTPNNTVGSQGAYGSATPLQSATASNGFVLFDSDFLETSGVVGDWMGIAPAPHKADLTTDMIDLSGHSNTELTFTQYYRRFAGPGSSQMLTATYVEFSIDGGSSWPYSVMLNYQVPVNSSTSLNDIVFVDCSQYVDGQDSVKIRFRFDGDFYVWMIDDIKLAQPSANSMHFMHFQGAEPVDLTFLTGSNQVSSKLGHTLLSQARPLVFDANVFNNGLNNQHNLQLHVNILENNTVMHTASSDTVSMLGAGDSVFFNSLNTYNSPWTPSDVGDYKLVYVVQSDSVTVSSDTFNYYVTHTEMSTDFNSWDNSIGASSNWRWGDGSQVCNRIDLMNQEVLYGVYVYLSEDTEPGAQLELAIYDSSGWDAVNGGFDNNHLLKFGHHTIDASDTVNGYVYFDFYDKAMTTSPMLTDSSYFFNVTMYNNMEQHHIRLRNDQTWPKEPGTGYMYLAGINNWYEGYSGSRSFNHVWIRGNYCPIYYNNWCVEDIPEVELDHVLLMPNPAQDLFQIDFGLTTGQFNLKILDLHGRVVDERSLSAVESGPIDVSHLPSGMYMVSLSKEGYQRTIKLAVQ